MKQENLDRLALPEKRLKSGGKVREVLSGSAAASAGIEPGDRIIAVDGHSVHDILEYSFRTAGASMVFTVLKKDGGVEQIQLTRNPDDDIGISFQDLTFDEIRICCNRCLFCFIEQLPPRLRRTLYVKDDDFRHSFFFGNFITLTNLEPADVDRILEQRLSPLYISVHTTDDELRCRLMGTRRAGGILEKLRQLVTGGISLHIQIVVCPGINDGPALDRTLLDLMSLGRRVESVGIVPVGLTKYQRNSAQIRPFTALEAAALIRQVQLHQLEQLNRVGERRIFLADEWYLLAQASIPDYEEYEDFPQLENGIGLVRNLWHDYEQMKKYLKKSRQNWSKYLVLTGASGKLALQPLIADINRSMDSQIAVMAVPSQFFGGNVTVTGLVTGEDIVRHLAGDDLSDFRKLIVPDVMLNHDNQLFLDDMSIAELRRQLKMEIEIAKTSAKGLLTALDMLDSQEGRKRLRNKNKVSRWH